MPYPSDLEILLGKLVGFGSLSFLVAAIIRGANEQWGWMVLMIVPAVVLGLMALRLLDTD